MIKMIKKLADLSTYLDGKGYREESYVIDYMLYSLAAEPPSWWSPVDRVRWEMEHAGDVKEQTRTKEIEQAVNPQAHKEAPTTPEPSNTPRQNFVVVEIPGFEPVKVTKVSQVLKLSKNPKVPHNAIIASIYNAIQPGSGSVVLETGKTLQDAIASGVNQKVLEDDKWFWQK